VAGEFPNLWITAAGGWNESSTIVPDGEGGTVARTALALGAAAAALAHRGSRGRTRRIAREIARLDPRTAYQQIVYLSGAYDFPLDLELSLSLALLRTFGSPSISRLLDATGEFRERPRKRYDDTELLLAHILEGGWESPDGRAATRRINAMHGAYDISSEDMLYVLSTFVIEPLRWNDRYGWRPVSAAEREAGFQYWRHLGPRLMVRDVPATLDELWGFNADYERRNLVYADTNARVAEATLQPILARLPRPAHGLFRQALAALYEPHVRRAFGWPDPPKAVRRGVDGALRGRAVVLRELVPERRRPNHVLDRKRPTYPAGHRVEELGTFPAVNPSRRARQRA
jgi:hypothetical protein